MTLPVRPLPAAPPQASCSSAFSQLPGSGWEVTLSLQPGLQPQAHPAFSFLKSWLKPSLHIPSKILGGKKDPQFLPRVTPELRFKGLVGETWSARPLFLFRSPNLNPPPPPPPHQLGPWHCLSLMAGFRPLFSRPHLFLGFCSNFTVQRGLTH